MNFKNLLKFSTLVVVFAMVLSSLALGQARYLNSTDGDDSYDGTSPTHDSPTVGPKRTLTGAFTAFASGTTVYMSAGNYVYNQSGIGGGNDAAGYTLGTGANKSMTFVVTTYNSNNVVNLSTGPLVINCGTGTITFRANNAGVQSVSFSGVAMTFTSGTLDVSGITFNVAGGTTNNTVTEGAFKGSPVYANNAMTVTYNGTTSKAAGAEMPSTLANLVLSQTAASTITFNSPITFGTTGGGVANTTTPNRHALFNGLVTLSSATGAVNATIVNSQASDTWTFVGGVTVKSTVAANGIVIDNQNTGTIAVTGALTFVQPAVTGTVDGNHTSSVRNNAGGALNLTGGVIETATGVVTGIFAASRTPVVNFNNAAAGTANIGGGSSTTFTGTFINAALAGTVNLTGPVTVKGALTNGAGHTIALGSYDLTLSGGSTNNGTITSSGIGSGYVIYTAATVDAGAGVWPNIRKTGTGALTITTAGAGTVSGNVENTGSGLFTLNAATTITGDVSLSGSGGITLAAVTALNGNVSVTGSGTLTTAATTIGGTTTMSNGGITLGGNTTLMGAYTQSGGTLNFATFILDVKNNFTRNAGNVTPGTGTLQFSAGGSQVFSGGTNLEVYNFTVTGVGTGVTFTNGSIMVDNNATIVSNTNVILSTYNIRMLGLNAVGPGNNVFSNAGQYTSVGGGGVICENPGVGATSVGYITGNGVNSNIEIRLANETDFIEVSAGTVVTWSGLLTLTRGTILVTGAGAQFNPSTVLTVPTIQRNLGDANTDVNPDGRPITLAAGGVFNSTGKSYHLTYYNLNAMVPGGSNVGPEFVTGANARVINLTINATGQPVILPVAGALYKFSGNLTIANSAELRLAGVLGTDDLVSIGTGITHSIIGLLSHTGTATLSLVGDGTINGGTNTTAPADASTISDLVVNTATPSATYNINNLKLIGSAGTDALTLNAGTVNLGMLTYGAPATIGAVRNFNINAGTLNLTANASLAVNFALAGGTFNFGNYNLYTNTAGATVNATGGAFAATGATTGGYLVYATNGNLTTGTILVPRIMIANGSTLTLTGNSGVSDIFQDYDATPTAGTLALGANTFVLAGGTWNAIGTYTGTGTTQVTGATNINLGASITVPNFELKNTTNTANLVNNTGGAAPSLTVGTLFTSTNGKLYQDGCDVILTNGGGVAFSYAGGTFTATTSNTITATDGSNGEFVFNAAGNLTINVAATGLIFPNVRVSNTGNLLLAAAPNNNPFTIANRLVLSNTGDVVVGADGVLTIGDGCLIKRMNNAGILNEVPIFAGVVDNQYNGAAAIVQAKEAKSTLRNLYIVNAAGIATQASKIVTVTGTLYLYTGDYDLEATATIYPITMGPASTVNVRDGRLINSGSTTVTQLAGGPITLTYSNTAAGPAPRQITNREYPTATGFVSTLNVNSNTGAATAGLQLNADHSCGDFVLATGNSTTPINDCRFDLNGKVLTVTNTTSATLTRGILSSEAGPVAPATYNTPATLTVAGSLTSAAAASIQNVNITAATLNLAGPFGQAIYGAATFTNITGAVVSGTSTITTFNGNLTGVGNITINGAHSNGTITASADVTVGTNGTMAATSNLAFIGTANSTLKVPAIGATIGALTLNKTNNTNIVYLNTGNLATSANTTFINGLFYTGSNTFNMWVPPFGGGQGFTRGGVTGTNISHVVGNLAKTLKNAGGPGLAGSSEPRQEFPVGTTTAYRPAAVTFNPAFGLPTTPNATLIIKALDGNAGGSVGLPIKDGIDTGVDVARYYPNFYWTIASNPFSIGPTTPFDLELGATGLTDYDDINNVRIIRRHGAVADINNEWLLQGTNSSYDNSMNGTTPTIIQRNANAGLRVGGAVFALGLKSNISLKTPIAKQWLVLSAGARTVSIANTFKAASGVTLQYFAQSSNAAVATVVSPVAGTSLSITPVALGDCYVTVTAVDPNSNDFFAYTFPVNVATTDVQSTEQLPTDFALYQNFPNPFNPTTNIKFDLPKEANVTLKVYNVLGAEVATLIDRVMPAGRQTITFDASKLASGMYIYRIQADNFVQIKKMLLMK